MDSNIFYLGSKHTTVTLFGMSQCTTFQGCTCLNVSHLKLVKDLHNIFAYYVRIYPKQKIISFYKMGDYSIFV
jgi:hypothetical protein